MIESTSQDRDAMFFTLVIVATVLVYVWFFEGRTARDWVYLPGAAVVAFTFWHNVRHRAWGFDWKTLRGASRLTAVWTAIAVAGIFVAGADQSSRAARLETEFPGALARREARWRQAGRPFPRHVDVLAQA